MSYIAPDYDNIELVLGGAYSVPSGLLEFVFPPPPISAGLQIAEGGQDTFAGRGGIEIEGALSAQEAGSDTPDCAGIVAWPNTGAMVAQEATQDTLAASGAVLISGSMSLQEAGSDSLSSSGKVVVTGVGGVTEGSTDTVSVTGEVFVTATASIREAEMDTAQALVLGPRTVHLTVAEQAADTFTSEAVVFVQGNAAIQETTHDSFFAASRIASTGYTYIHEEAQDTAQALGEIETWVTDPAPSALSSISHITSTSRMKLVISEARV